MADRQRQIDRRRPSFARGSRRPPWSMAGSSNSSQAPARVSRRPASTRQVVLLLAQEGGRLVTSLDVAVEDRPLRKPQSARDWRPRSWRSSSAGVSRPTPSRLAPTPAEVAFRRQSTRASLGGADHETDRAGPRRNALLADSGAHETPAERARYLCSAAGGYRLTRRARGRSDRAKRSPGRPGPDDPDRGKGIAGSRPSGRSLFGNAIVARVARLGAGAPLSLGESTSGAICSRPSLHEARTSRCMCRCTMMRRRTLRTADCRFA